MHVTWKKFKEMGEDFNKKAFGTIQFVVRANFRRIYIEKWQIDGTEVHLALETSMDTYEGKFFLRGKCPPVHLCLMSFKIFYMQSLF